MSIITDTELASYLERAVTPALTMKVDLANDLVLELPYATPLAEPYSARVRAITLEVAARAVRNPNGASSETVDDYTYRLPSETRQAGVYLTDAERAELLALGGVSRGTSYTIAMTSPLDVP